MTHKAVLAVGFLALTFTLFMSRGVFGIDIESYNTLLNDKFSPEKTEGPNIVLVKASKPSLFNLKETKRYDEISLPKNLQTIPLLEASRNINPQARVEHEILVVDDMALSGENSGINGVSDSQMFIPTSDQISVYTVRPGDTIEQIAEMYDVNTRTIRDANDLGANDKIKPGQVLEIYPIPGVKYVTKVANETITSIVKKYGADATEVAGFNNVSPTETLVPGTQIIIPEGDWFIGPNHSNSTTQKTNTVSKTNSKNTTTNSKRFVRPLKGGVLTQGIHGQNAVDFGAPIGTPVYASADGVVLIISTGWGGGYGNRIVIKHGDKSQTLYAHLSQISVSAGETVKQGQQIGATGNTGNSTGPHLHFEIRGAGITNPFAR